MLGMAAPYHDGPVTEPSSPSPPAPRVVREVAEREIQDAGVWQVDDKSPAGMGVANQAMTQSPEIWLSKRSPSPRHRSPSLRCRAARRRPASRSASSAIWF